MIRKPNHMSLVMRMKQKTNDNLTNVLHISSVDTCQIFFDHSCMIPPHTHTHTHPNLKIYLLFYLRSTASWPIECPVEETQGWRHVRLQQAGKNASGQTHYLSLSGFEIYGKVTGVCDDIGK